MNYARTMFTPTMFSRRRRTPGRRGSSKSVAGPPSQSPTKISLGLMHLSRGEADTGASEKNTPPETKTLWNIGSQSTKSGAGEQLFGDGLHGKGSHKQRSFLFTDWHCARSVKQESGNLRAWPEQALICEGVGSGQNRKWRLIKGGKNNKSKVNVGL